MPMRQSSGTQVNGRVTGQRGRSKSIDADAGRGRQIGRGDLSFELSHVIGCGTTSKPVSV